MSALRERLEETKRQARNAVENNVAKMSAQTEASIDCAIEIAESLMSLTVAVNDMANRSLTVTNNVIEAINKSTQQLVVSSNESTSVARESAKLSATLNRLTIWIIAAAILSAAAAGLQAWVAWYSVRHPQPASSSVSHSAMTATSPPHLYRRNVGQRLPWQTHTCYPNHSATPSGCAHGPWVDAASDRTRASYQRLGIDCPRRRSV
jgi:hypothetical protein